MATSRGACQRLGIPDQRPKGRRPRERRQAMGGFGRQLLLRRRLQRIVGGPDQSVGIRQVLHEERGKGSARVEGCRRHGHLGQPHGGRPRGRYRVDHVRPRPGEQHAGRRLFGTGARRLLLGFESPAVPAKPSADSAVVYVPRDGCQADRPPLSRDPRRQRQYSLGDGERVPHGRHEPRACPAGEGGWWDGSG